MKFSIYYPIKPVYITQKFGETAFLDYYKANGINFLGHNGLDLVAKYGEPIYAAHDGYAYYEIDQNQGHGVVLRTNQIFDYLGQQVFYKTIYWHLVDSKKDPAYKSPVEGYSPTGKGLEVKAGDIIGYADSTGISTGNHLHFGLKPCLPGEPVGTWGNILQNNGYQGAIDPTPYFNGKNAADINSHESPFTLDLELGDQNTEVARLQLKLQKLGYFPATQNATGYYGSVTRASVFLFQQDYIINLTFLERNLYRGRYFGQKTRAALNRI